MHVQAAGENMALVVDLGHRNPLRLLLLLITPKMCLSDFHPKSSQPNLFLWEVGGCAVPGPRADIVPIAQLCILEMLSTDVTGQTKLLGLAVPLASFAKQSLIQCIFPNPHRWDCSWDSPWQCPHSWTLSGVIWTVPVMCSESQHIHGFSH